MGTPRDEWASAWSWDRRDTLINLEGEMVEVSRSVGQWLRRNARPTDLVAVNHAGAVPYYSDLPTLDMAGLNDLHIARAKGPRHGKLDPAYVMSRKPAFIVLNTRVAPLSGVYVPGYWRGETAIVEHPDFQRYYVAVDRAWMWRHRSLDTRAAHNSSQSYIMVFRRDESRYRVVGRCLDFESGSFAGWQVEGTAFGRRPATGPRGYQWVEGFLGSYLASSFARSDRPTGSLRRTITVEGTGMDLLVGGCKDPAGAGVRLWHEGQAVQQATGRGDGRLRPVTWDLSGLRGKQATIEIYDNSSKPWGHVMADQLCQFVRGPGQAGSGTVHIIEPRR